MFKKDIDCAHCLVTNNDNRYRDLINASTGYGIYRLDQNGIVISWNSGVERFKDYLSTEILGSHFSIFYTPEDQANGEPQRVLDAASKSGLFEGEGWRVRKDGSLFWAYIVIEPIRAAEGNIIGFAKVTRDLTHSRETQLALDRTKEALAQSQKMDAIGQLTGGIAHDFNNVLATILGSLELVRKNKPEDAKTLRLVDIAIQAAQRGTSLTRRMLTFARHHDIKSQLIDIPLLVVGMMDLLHSSLGPSVTITAEFPQSLPAIRSDPHQLELALLNLALNARDAMPNGGTLKFSASVRLNQGEAATPKGDFVCFCVSDDGSGMDQLTLARATEPFFSTKPTGRGTGLGLSMVHGIVTQSGGRLHLNSKPGEGTTVEIWFPLNLMSACEVNPAATVHAEIRQKSQLCVLIVDDDPLLLLITKAMLEDLGHEALAVDSGAKAIELLRQRPDIGVMITDQGMPGMTGLQLLKAVKAEWPKLPLILATGYVDLPPGVLAGTLTIFKPALQDDLARAIADVTQNQAPWLSPFA